jgi:hypothetical protein
MQRRVGSAVLIDMCAAFGGKSPMKPNLALVLAISTALAALPLATNTSWAKGRGGGGHFGRGHLGHGHFAVGHLGSAFHDDGFRGAHFGGMGGGFGGHHGFPGYFGYGGYGLGLGGGGLGDYRGD